MRPIGMHVLCWRDRDSDAQFTEDENWQRVQLSQHIGEVVANTGRGLLVRSEIAIGLTEDALFDACELWPMADIKVCAIVFHDGERLTPLPPHMTDAYTLAVDDTMMATGACGAEYTVYVLPDEEPHLRQSHPTEQADRIMAEVEKLRSR